MMIEYYDRTYGMLCVHKNLDIPEENSPLWTIEYLLRGGKKVNLVLNVIDYWHKCKTPTKGLYNQRPWIDGGHEDYLSNDQLIALICANHALPTLVMETEHGTERNRWIWSYLWKHLFTYNNITSRIDFKRLMQPKAVFVSAYSAGLWIVLPLLSLACIFSCLSGEMVTSGKLKAWTIMTTFNMSFTKKICTYLVGSWDYVFNVYFWQEGHDMGSEGETWR